MSGFLLVALVVIAFNVVFLVVVVRYGLQRRPPVRPKPGPLEGLDDQVRRAIETGDPDDMLILYAENVAVREWNATHPLDDRTQFHKVPLRTGEWASNAGGPVSAWTVSVPHVTATTPRMRIVRYPPCTECEFETLTMFGGEVAIPVRTVVCPAHQEEE